MIRALAFDIQGTAVDFYQPLMRLGAETNAHKSLALDWAALSVAWRQLYREAMDEIIAGQAPWRRVDRIYRDALDVLLDREGLGGAFAPDERDAVNAVWTRLEPWPDARDGLARLRRSFTLTTLSNAGMASLVALVKHAALPFDAILSAELSRSYKPAPAVYQLAVDYLGIAAENIMMVACHSYDLDAAATFGMKTAFVTRPLEFGPVADHGVEPLPRFDVNARDFLDLADQLGA